MRRGPLAAMRRLAAGAAVLLLGACASVPPPHTRGTGDGAPVPAGRFAAVAACSDWYARLDAGIDAAGVRDAQDARVEGYPHLRVSRMLAAARTRANDDPALARVLLGRMVALDLAARRHEIANLPEPDRDALRGGRGAPEPLARTRACAELLHQVDLADAARRAQILERAGVPDDYVTAQRVVGLYALTQVPFSEGVRRHQDEVRASFARPLSRGTGVQRFSPADAGTLPRPQVAELLAAAARDPLGMGEPAAADLDRLFATYAPVYDLEVSGAHDRFGALGWGTGATPVVDPAQPVVYRRLAWTRVSGRVLPQLVYTIWFSERPADGTFDLLAGALDGLVWRVTLDTDGAPLVYDTMHPCGCYHMFFPTARAQPVPAPEGEYEWAFVPQQAPSIGEGERIVLRVAARTHFVERVERAPGEGAPPPATRYGWSDEDALRSLPLPGGGHRSTYGPDGLVAGTERAERFLFWPMGIPSAGAMRQWGRHATAFVGRRHFDDADLIEKRFTIAPR